MTAPTSGATGDRPRCRCGVYVDRHDRIEHRPRKASRLRLWFRDHDLRAHVVAPIWVRLPEKWRWTVVTWLNRSQTRCWSSLVDAALLTYREDDACDIRTPLGCSAGRCATTCDWIGGAKLGDHVGEHACSCYCGKFEFTAPEGGDERHARAEQGDTPAGWGAA